VTINVEINDISVDIEDGATLGDIINKTRTSHIPGATIGIVLGGELKEEQTTEYSLRTNKGEFKIEVDPDKPEFNKKWITNFIGKELRAHWSTPDAVAFGPVETDIEPDKSNFEYQRYDLIFGTGGYNAKNSYVVISKGRHTASHGSPADGGVFAKVISGKNIVSQLDQGDTINQIESVIRWETLTDKITTSDLNTPLEDGMKIFTYFSIDMKKEAPLGAEHFIGLVRKGLFQVDDISSSYLVNDILKSEDVVFENLDSRSEGNVSVRTEGEGLGRVFISKEDRTSSAVHSIVGTITKGVELVKLAEKGNQLEVRINPPQIMFLGLTIEQCKALAEERGLTLEIDGYDGDGAIVVEQLPEATLQIVESKHVSLLFIPPQLLLHIKFYYDKAPTTIEFFKHALRLKQRPVGPLPIYFNYENTVLFKTIKRAEKYKELMPENTPTEKVMAGEVGVTNQASKQYGIIGVKTIDDCRYGPTGEKFHSTNIIGKVMDPEKLGDLKQGDIIYIIEVE
jgi:putative methanogenesis marker protein 3